MMQACKYGFCTLVLTRFLSISPRDSANLKCVYQLFPAGFESQKRLVVASSGVDLNSMGESYYAAHMPSWYPGNHRSYFSVMNETPRSAGMFACSVRKV